METHHSSQATLCPRCSAPRVLSNHHERLSEIADLLSCGSREVTFTNSGSKQQRLVPYLGDDEVLPFDSEADMETVFELLATNMNLDVYSYKIWLVFHNAQQNGKDHFFGIRSLAELYKLLDQIEPDSIPASKYLKAYAEFKTQDICSACWLEVVDMSGNSGSFQGSAVAAFEDSREHMRSSRRGVNSRMSDRGESRWSQSRNESSERTLEEPYQAEIQREAARKARIQKDRTKGEKRQQEQDEPSERPKGFSFRDILGSGPQS